MLNKYLLRWVLCATWVLREAIVFSLPPNIQMLTPSQTLMTPSDGKFSQLLLIVCNEHRCLGFFLDAVAFPLIPMCLQTLFPWKVPIAHSSSSFVHKDRKLKNSIALLCTSLPSDTTFGVLQPYLEVVEIKILNKSIHEALACMPYNNPPQPSPWLYPFFLTLWIYNGRVAWCCQDVPPIFFLSTTWYHEHLAWGPRIPAALLA